MFAVIGMVTADYEARTVGVVCTASDRKLYTSTLATAWTACHIAANPHVSLTIPIARRIPVMPWIKIPAATITFAGTARVYPAREAIADLLRAILGPMADNEETIAETTVPRFAIN